MSLEPQCRSKDRRASILCSHGPVLALASSAVPLARCCPQHGARRELREPGGALAQPGALDRGRVVPAAPLPALARRRPAANGAGRAGGQPAGGLGRGARRDHLHDGHPGQATAGLHGHRRAQALVAGVRGAHRLHARARDDARRNALARVAAPRPRVRLLAAV
eukprot:6566658-Prymnesium_polylepis.1